ncbi:LacI family DNA-binding transcriptional regulator [Agromyces mangrovi Wang et al. 2018]|uniref:LacI family DNA-binding transcriptional regulator n=1 Tax=Agromyces mangrovi TaxID=1858653 RepID=UPI002572994E|nr:substrate-binding domain-containing protein [Agromyces mangrovi]BDZ65083.1 transcriptional regulator [Agromyces mangrovi]
MSEPATTVTLKDVAEAAGVSVGTASRALSGRGDLTRGTRERVAEIARTLGYERSSGPRGRPTTLDPRLIEFVLGSFDDAWTDAMTTGAREAAFRLGFDLVLTLDRPDPSDDWPTRVATRRPTGVVIGIIRPTASQLAQIRGLRIPIVLLDPMSDPEGELASVGTTDWQGGYDAGAHLAGCDVERFAVVTGVPRYRFGRAREEGFRQAIAELRPDAEIAHVDSRWTDSPLTADLMKLVTDKSRVGVFACNDEMALAVYRAAARAGKRIPEDLSVVGFNDEPRAASSRPPLTSVHQPLRDMAARAIELVPELRRHDDAVHDRIELPCTLVVRGSTRPR